MVLGPGKIFGSLFTVAAILVALTIVVRFQVSTRMLRVTGELADEPGGSNKAITYSIGRLGTSRANSVNVKVRYHYVVNGKTYEGTTLSLNGNSYGTHSEEKIKKLISDLTQSSVISVWYDPKRPYISVILEPQIGTNSLIWLGLLTLAAFLCFYSLDQVVLRLQRKT
jgi:hypothetical protein